MNLFDPIWKSLKELPISDIAHERLALMKEEFEKVERKLAECERRYKELEEKNFKLQSEFAELQKKYLSFLEAHATPKRAGSTIDISSDKRINFR